MFKLLDEKILSLDNGNILLKAGKCPKCNKLHFPIQDNCSICDTENELTILPTMGKLWSWTSQNFQPKSPPFDDQNSIENFEPYFIGHIELCDGLRITSKLTNIHFEDIKIGMPLKLTAIEFKSFKTKEIFITYAFKPY
jgi:uncharacterized protein